jgi:hypothetical protein
MCYCSLFFIQWGASLVLIFLLWNLEYLALVSGIVWTIVIIASERISRNMRKRLGWSIMEEIKKARKRSD